MPFIYLSGVIHEDADVVVEIERRVRFVRACYQRLGPEINDLTTASFSLKIRMLKAEVIETLLSGCVTWDPQRGSLQQAPIGAPRSPRANPGLPASCRLRHVLVRQSPGDGEMRENRNDHPETPALLRGRNGPAKQRATTQSGDVGADIPLKNQAPGGPPNNWLRTLGDDVAVFRSTEDRSRRFGVETLLWVDAARKGAKWHRGSSKQPNVSWPSGT